MPPANRTCSSSALTAFAPVRAEMFEQQFAHRFPEDEAGTRADVSAALAALEDETPRPVAQEQRQQSRRGNVQIGGDAFFFQLLRLIGPAAGDESEGRTDGADGLDLFARGSPAARSRECRRPRAGRPSRSLRLAQQFLRVVAAEQSQSEEGQRAVGGDGFGERGGIADARHRALHDRIARAVPLGQRRTFGQRRQAARRFDLLGDALTQRLHDAADGAIAVGQRFGEGGVLSDQPQARFRVRGRRMMDGLPPLSPALCGGAVEAASCSAGGTILPRRQDRDAKSSGMFHRESRPDIASRCRRRRQAEREPSSGKGDSRVSSS